MTTETATEDATPPAAPERPADAQSYLIGESIYLRGAQLSDARWATAWRQTPFPISAEKAEEHLKASVPKDAERHRALLIACRRDDGRPVGSARVDYGDPITASLTLHADPALGEAGGRVQAEMLAQLVPWVTGERFKPAVSLVTDADLTPVVTEAQRLGMRPAVRLRLGVWRDGAHRDRLFLELLNPVWVGRLGDPGAGIAEQRAPVAMPTARSPRRLPGESLPLPPNALIGSERLALRPMEVSDAETIANLIRAEPAPTFGHSRFPYSAITLAKWFNDMGESEPSGDFEFAVIRRDTGELIGETGLYSVDWIAGTAESGYWLYRAGDRGMGYGTEANLLLLEYAFDRLKLNMIWAWVKARNPRSQAALRKQGYRDAGRFTWSGYGPDGYENALMFDVLASEWRGWRG